MTPRLLLAAALAAASALGAPNAALLAAASALGAPNGNCLPRGQCIPTFPRYPDQHTLCLAANDSAWHCAALAGVWGDADWSFGPGSERDATMMGGMGVDLNETFTTHALPAGSPYGLCTPSGAEQWEVTRELSYDQGTVTGNCTTSLYASGRMLLGTFTHPCAVLTQITLEADETGAPRCVGCRCCTTCTGCACLPP